MNDITEYADYQVIDHGLGGIRSYLESTSRNAFITFANLIDQATSGSRGRYATIALNMAGVTRDQKAISRVYEENPAIIDRYFEQVDVVALARKLDVDNTVAGKVAPELIRAGSYTAVGIIAGVAGLKLYNRKRTSK